MIKLDLSQGYKYGLTIQINWYDTSYQQKKTQKPHDYLNKYRKSIWLNLTPIHDKNSYESKHRGSKSQQDENCLWQSESISLLFMSNSATSWTVCRSLGSSVHGFFQARILEWVAIPFSRESSQPRDQTWVSCIAGRFFTIWATREAHLWQSTRPV